MAKPAARAAPAAPCAPSQPPPSAFAAALACLRERLDAKGAPFNIRAGAAHAGRALWSGEGFVGASAGGADVCFYVFGGGRAKSGELVRFCLQVLDHRGSGAHYAAGPLCSMVAAANTHGAGGLIPPALVGEVLAGLPDFAEFRALFGC